MDLFDAQGAEKLDRRAPLAERLRPKSLDEVVGQDHLTGPGRPLRAALEKGRGGAIVLWGPPGTGKTTLARVLATETEGEFVPLSAVTSGVKEVRASLQAARERLKYEGRATILFVDEVHRFNKAQQDVLLPALEEGLADLSGPLRRTLRSSLRRRSSLARASCGSGRSRTGTSRPSSLGDVRRSG